MARAHEIVIVTGAGGFIGGAAAKRLSERYDVVGLDLHPGDDPALAASVGVNLASDQSVADALEQVRARFGTRIASVIHLAAYFDLTGEPNPKYQEITVDGTRITISIIAMAEVGRPLRFINVPFGIWLIAAPWLLTGASTLAAVNGVLAGLLLIGLSLPRGTRSAEHYGGWDRFVA